MSTFSILPQANNGRGHVTDLTSGPVHEKIQAIQNVSSEYMGACCFLIVSSS